MELYINTFGASLSRDNEAFVISNTNGSQRIPVAKVHSIHIGRSIQVTSDAIMLAIENDIEVFFTERSGEPMGRVWSPKYGSISSIRKGQLQFTFSHDAVSWIKDILCKKMENQQALLLMMVTKDEAIERLRNKAISRIEDYKSKVMAIEGEVVPDVAPSLRGWEGMAAKIYFEAMNLFLPEYMRFKERTQHPATDIVNAMLNYGYGMLYGRIEGLLIKSGVDPYIGVLHRDDYNRPVLVYDIIELYRVWVDYVVWGIACQNIITEDFYSVNEDGAYWLENIGRRILIQSLNDFLDEIITVNRIKRSRLTHIQLYIQKLAQDFKNFS